MARLISVLSYLLVIPAVEFSLLLFKASSFLNGFSLETTSDSYPFLTSIDFIGVSDGVCVAVAYI